jgi:hypothetical protein
MASSDFNCLGQHQQASEEVETTVAATDGTTAAPKSSTPIPNVRNRLQQWMISPRILTGRYAAPARQRSAPEGEFCSEAGHS